MAGMYFLNIYLLFFLFVSLQIQAVVAILNILSGSTPEVGKLSKYCFENGYSLKEKWNKQELLQDF